MPSIKRRNLMKNGVAVSVAGAAGVSLKANAGGHNADESQAISAIKNWLIL